MLLAGHLLIVSLLLSVGGYCVGSAGVKTSPTALDNFEPIDFSVEEVKKQHANVKLRNSQKNREWRFEDTISTQRKQSHISIRFKGYARMFILQLSPDTSSLHPNVEFNIIDENGKRQASYDPATFYTGRVLGDANSYVHGHVLQSGQFDGIIHAYESTFHIEPASRFLSNPSFHTLLYRYSDVTKELRNVNRCDYEKHLKELEEQYWPKSTQESVNGSLFSSIGNERRRLRRDHFLENPICPVYLAADHTFFQSVVGGNDETQSINELVTHLNEANQIFTRTDFNGDGSQDNIGFALARVDVFTSVNAQDYRLGGVFTSSNSYLDTWSQYNHDVFCLALLFGYRELDAGVLGLAWVGGSSSAGICGDNVNTNLGRRSRNTAIVTLLNFGQRQPRAVSTITVAHEWGHNYGSFHDPINDILCAPGEFGLSVGNFLMYSRATDGTQANNNRFSSCSINAIRPVLEGRSGCFLPTTAVCGNGLVEGDEECDCGDVAACQDPCCVAMGAADPPQTTACRFVAGASCTQNSATGSVCCDSSCQFVSASAGKLCEGGTVCTSETVCDGTSAMCPEPVTRPDGANCSLTQTCQEGQCVGSICASTNNHTTECQCAARIQLCHVCCQIGEDRESCTSISELGEGFGVLFREPGRSCSNFRGYCTMDNECDLVDNNSVLNSLLNLFSLENALLFKDWLAQYWYIPIIIVIVIIILAILLHVTYRKKKDTIKDAASNTMQRARNTMGRRTDQPAAPNRHRRNRSHKIQKMLPQQALTRLKRFFPTVGLDTLKDIMVTSQSEEAAVGRLLDAGYPLFRVDPNAQQSS